MIWLLLQWKRRSAAMTLWPMFTHSAKSLRQPPALFTGVLPLVMLLYVRAIDGSFLELWLQQLKEVLRARLILRTGQCGPYLLA